MSDRSRTCDQATSAAIPSVISSRASVSGPTLCGEPDGPTPEQCGPDPALANLSARQAKEKGLLTSGTCGRRSSISSGSAILQHYLGNRLRAKTASLGSTLLSLTWKVRTTPVGRGISALRASVRHTSGKDCTSLDRAPWITPQTHDITVRGNVMADHHYKPHDLSNQGLLAGWRSPDNNKRGGDYSDPDKVLKRMVAGHQVNLNDQAVLTSPWSTAQIAGWPTTTTRDWKDGKEQLNVPLKALLGRVVWLTDSGQTPNGSTAATVSSGQLNPGLPRWLQGLPIGWESCADMVTLSRRKLRKVS